MVQFHIQPESDIPASKQLFDQIQFAIASRQFPPGHRLPSTRQLATMTGLHRNTVSKVYRQLEEAGLVSSQAGSGIYVKALGHEGGTHRPSPVLEQFPEAYELVQSSIDRMLARGCSLEQVRHLFLTEIDWRSRCSARVLVTVPRNDLGAGKLIVQDITPSLGVPVELVPLEELAAVLEQTDSATVVTSRYFIGEAEAIASPKSVRAIPVDIHNYADEIATIAKLPQHSRLGIVSISTGVLPLAERLAYSLRGEDILIVTAQVSDSYKLNALVRTANTIVCDHASYARVRSAILAARDDLIRPPELICSENYIGQRSIDTLKRELGLGESAEDSPTRLPEKPAET